MNNEIKEILEALKPQDEEFAKAGIKEYPLALSVKEQKILLDYITNLQEKVEQYENPDDMTLMFMWLDEKAKDKEIERLRKREKKWEKWTTEKEILSTKMSEYLCKWKNIKREYKNQVESNRLKKQKIERLNNIIDELEKYIENTNKWFIEFKPEEKLIKKAYICVQDLKDKLKELKNK